MGKENLWEIISKAKQGDREAVGEIIDMFKPYILKFTSSIFINGYDREDLIQYGYMSVIKAIKIYKEDSGINFSAYVKGAIKNNYYCEIRNLARKNYETSLDIEEEGGFRIDLLTDPIDVEEEVEKRYTISNVKKILSELSLEDRKLISYHIKYGRGGISRYAKEYGKSLLNCSRRKDKLYKYIRERLMGFKS
ncbi:sigma-70 family RNA polymerase sigma factor [Clostridium sp. 19966]|uniref:sigma-70 family RNA polymerase sigma factor n=1 Tax=Clostridium sp. 19966 TaxID=2768166 RepID=UPI0028DE0F5F|nr:sigma-70 family RNA polymerase sigma factor [Clostridium sp. 19966]MDT8716115.1 sigma-70 family RNA polymerase sigma factor [Clostridium sp. 19966]